MSYRVVDAYACECQRCGHKWIAMKPPKACAKCKQIGWKTEPGLTGLGRPPKRRKRGRPVIEGARKRKPSRGKS